MANPIKDKNLDRYSVNRYVPDENSPFCLSQVINYEPDNSTLIKKRRKLLAECTGNLPHASVQQLCNLGGCTLKIIESPEDGRTVYGNCKAAAYCLKTAFLAVIDTKDPLVGKALYKDILDSLEGCASKYSAGNFCPRLDCGLSAGVSADMIPGMAGECSADKITCQQRLDFDNAG